MEDTDNGIAQAANVEVRTAQTDMRDLDKILDEYEVKLGLPKFEFSEQDDEVKEYLNYSRDVLEKLTPDQCSEIALILTSFAFHLQRAKNRDEGRIIWAEGKMKILSTPRISNYRAGSFNQNFDAAIIDDGYTLKLLEIRNHAAVRAKRLDYMGNIIRDKAESYKELGRTKRNRDK